MRNYRGWLLAASAAAACGLLIVGLQWQRSRAVATPEALWSRLPAREAAVFYIDFAALRRTGFLEIAGASAVAAEPEYRDFIEKTRFDYTRDLDSVMAAFAPSGRYFLVRGRFDWPRLRAWAAESGGRCRNRFCTMPGSTPQRKISFLPLRDDLMAMAVGPDEMAVEALTRPSAASRPLEMPSDPVWASLPPAALKSGDSFPAGTRMFARGLEEAENVLLALGPDGPRFALRLDVRCRSAGEAEALAETMRRATGVLRGMIERERQTPNPRDLSGVLTAGSFRSEIGRASCRERV